MKLTATVPFEITSWEQSTVLAGDGAQITRAMVGKKFTGELQGESIAEALLCGTDSTGLGYIAMERITGTLAGKRGSFIVQHGGVGTPSGPQAFGDILAGSGTGELASIRGTARYAHDESGARVVLDYEV